MEYTNKVAAVVGSNWGDEGKGKITDMLAKQADFVVRYQGGANAGHTIINSYGKFALHSLPSGVFYQHITNIIGNGVALSPLDVKKELDFLAEKNVPAPRLAISNRAQIVMSYHKSFDAYEEDRLAGKSYGSTKSGIAPFYSDKYAKIGFQVSELFDTKEALMEHIEKVCVLKNVYLEHLYKKPLLQAEDIYKELMQYKEILEPYIQDTAMLLRKATAENKRILLEGQLGSLKDTDQGIYPMVTSSSTLAGFASVGAGVSPLAFTDIICVCKAYSSAVGAGEFVSELFGDEAEELRRRGGDGGEYGATTGRPRRVGWLDTVASRYGCEIQGANQVAFTVLDVLGYLDELKICVGYEIDGEMTKEFPPTALLKKAKPVYKTVKGWKSDIRGIKTYEELPDECRAYIELAEAEIGIPITMISNGPNREDIIYRNLHSGSL